MSIHWILIYYYKCKWTDNLYTSSGRSCSDIRKAANTAGDGRNICHSRFLPKIKIKFSIIQN